MVRVMFMAQSLPILLNRNMAVTISETMCTKHMHDMQAAAMMRIQWTKAPHRTQSEPKNTARRTILLE